MTLSFPHLIYLAADSQYLFPDEGDVCRVTTSLYCAAGGHSALTAEPVCQLIRLDSFLSDLPDALNNCYPAVEYFAWWPLNSGHCVLHWGYLFLSCTQVCTEPLKAQNRRCIEKVNDGFVHSCPYSHNLNPVFIASLTPSSHGNHSPAIMRHLTPTLVFFFFFYKFLSHCHFPFYPHSIPPLSWSLYHCYFHTNLPAIAASPRTTFLTANLCSGRTHPSSGSLRCAASSPPAPRCAPSWMDPQLRTVCDYLWILLTKPSQAGDGQG